MTASNIDRDDAYKSLTELRVHIERINGAYKPMFVALGYLDMLMRDWLGDPDVCENCKETIWEDDAGAYRGDEMSLCAFCYAEAPKDEGGAL